MTWIGDIPFKELGMDEDKMNLLTELAKDNDYWRKAFSFVDQVRDREYSSLSDKQQDWLSNIVASLGVELNKIEGRFASNGN